MREAGSYGAGRGLWDRSCAQVARLLAAASSGCAGPREAAEVPTAFRSSTAGVPSCTGLVSLSSRS